MTGNVLYAANALGLQIFLVVNYKCCHCDKVRQIFPPTAKRHNDIIHSKRGMDVAPSQSRMK